MSLAAAVVALAVVTLVVVLSGPLRPSPEDRPHLGRIRAVSAVAVLQHSVPPELA
ncbi:MAG TPA: hypothetical protein H9786_06610 [Candidatus Brachybacterium merdavium]|uniref:Uncharacterized protein n=1 Tax=Candidatus Brachybacterium merdavium TaxID=2838513 RepID=A0A9D2RNB8_9MICO|nr:hypothetical protein [Candidatus Brachybacterium merdavium]